MGNECGQHESSWKEVKTSQPERAPCVAYRRSNNLLNIAQEDIKKKSFYLNSIYSDRTIVHETSKTESFTQPNYSNRKQCIGLTVCQKNKGKISWNLTYGEQNNSLIECEKSNRD